MLDDFHHLDLEIGAGTAPSVWSKITDGRTEGVDRALLGVWDAARYPAGRYTLRLTVYDSLGNSIQDLTPIMVGGQATPTPAGSPGPFTSPLMPPLFGPTAAPQPPGGPQQPGRPPGAAPSPAPGSLFGPNPTQGAPPPAPAAPVAAPTPTPRRR
jgi:hypothetical protein